MIVQHQSEARKRPSITALTTMWADQNISKMLVSGVAAAAATSAGFIGGGNLMLGGGTAGHGAKTGAGRGLRRKSAENQAFAGRRKSLIFSSPIKTLIGLKAGYQSEPPLASGESLPRLAASVSGPSAQNARLHPYPNRAAAFIVIPAGANLSPGGGRLMGALETFGWEWGSALFRWLHVIAAIAWIGGSFFFMHLDASLRKQAKRRSGAGGNLVAGARRRLLRDEEVSARSRRRCPSISSGTSGSPTGPG